MTYYYNIESQTIETEEAIKEAYTMFKSEYDENYSYFKEACMHYNNGALIPIKEGFTKCRFMIGHCTEAEQTIILTIEKVFVDSQRFIVKYYSPYENRMYSESVHLYQIDF